MMKKNIIFILSLAVLSGCTSVKVSTNNLPKRSIASQSDEETFKMSGFRVVKETDALVELSFSNEQDFIVSKNGFKSEKSAQSFCEQHYAKLDTEFNALLFAMSGASSHNSFIEDSISFSTAESSGIVSWAGKGANSVVVMLNGHGTDNEELSIDKFKNLNSNAKLPAICVASKK